MSFNDMPDLGPLLLPGAGEYAAECLRRSRQAVAQTRCILDVSYGSDPFQKLDIFLPPSPSRGAPVLFFLHGGAWKNGFKEWMGFMAPALIDLPAIFVTANYRMAPRVKLPTMLADCCDALDWVARNIKAHGGDPRRLFIGGHSAGGHLAALMALRPALFAERGQPADLVKGCFPLSAAFDLRRAGQTAARMQLLDLLLDQGADGMALSALTYVKSNGVPFFVAYGEKDQPNLIDENRAMIERLGEERCVLAQHVFAGCSHFDTHLACTDARAAWLPLVRSWLATAPDVRRR